MARTESGQRADRERTERGQRADGESRPGRHDARDVGGGPAAALEDGLGSDRKPGAERGEAVVLHEALEQGLAEDERVQHLRGRRAD